MTKVLDLPFRVPLSKPYCNLMIFFLRKLAKNKNSFDLSVTSMRQFESNLRLDSGLQVPSSLLVVGIFHKCWLKRTIFNYFLEGKTGKTQQSSLVFGLSWLVNQSVGMPNVPDQP